MSCCSKQGPKFSALSGVLAEGEGMWEPVLGEVGTLGPLPKPDQRMEEGSISLRPLHPEAPHSPKRFPPPGSGESNAPGERSVPTPRGRCRLALTVGDRRPPLPPLSRTAPHYTGLGRKGVRPGPRHPGAAQLKRRAQQPVGDHSSAGRRGSPASRSERGAGPGAGPGRRGRGVARRPGRVAQGAGS